MNIINIKKALFGMMASIALFSSCDNKEDNYIGEFSPYIAIEDIRALNRGSKVKLTSDKISYAKKIYGVVVSDHSDNNLPDDIVIIQQDKRNRTRGIAFKMSNASIFVPGDSLVINIQDKSLNKDGFLYLDGISETDIEKVSSGHRFTVRNTNAGTLNQQPNDFESTVIKIIGGEMYPRPAAQETLSGSKVMINGADTVNIVTLSSANFANEILPRNINVTGIPLGTKSDMYKFDIFPRHLRDIEDIQEDIFKIVSKELEIK